MDDEKSNAGEARETSCTGCGKAAREVPVPVSWVSSHEKGEARYFCENCARENIRAIEGRLDSSWW
ncbi:hypothetical protein ACFPA8_05555 [Streptomyces ovatisporus]|uniref:Uncharacterized protein n=1 Tax=Streptomyces ovatisporus TaxID=1128682 RepID=A0ABV9A1Q0_9ACTN